MLPLLLASLKAIGWAACVIYATIPSFWLAIHPYTNHWRSRRSPYRMLLPLWIAMWVLLGLLTAPWRHHLLYSAGWTWIPAVLLFVIGLWLYQRSASNFSAAQLGGLPEVVPGHDGNSLVTTGIRQWVRHPVYLAHLCEMSAWSIGTGLAALYALTLFGVVTGACMIREEEQELERRFGEAYRQYQKTVPAVLPKLLSHKLLP